MGHASATKGDECRRKNRRLGTMDIDSQEPRRAKLTLYGEKKGWNKGYNVATTISIVALRDSSTNDASGPFWCPGVEVSAYPVVR